MVIFRGRFEARLDSKSRLMLPASIRTVLSHGRQKSLIITNSHQQGQPCLDAVPLPEWEKLEKKVSQLPQLKQEVQNFQRFYLSGGHETQMDNQGRVLIPSSLRTYAGFGADVVIIGFAGKFEIWSAATWSTVFQKLVDTFPATLAQISNLEPKDE